MSPRDHFRTLPPLQTPRLILRPLADADTVDVFDYARDPAMSRFTSWAPHRSVEDSRAFIAMALSRYRSGEPMGYGVIDRASGKVIGTCGIESYSEQHERAEIAYAIGTRFWNQGLATEAARAVVDHSFRALPLSRLQSCCHVDNVGSARVMEKLGMRFEGVLRSYFKFRGRYDDVKYYSLLRAEWEANSTAGRII